jgi:hypothetical protein
MLRSRWQLTVSNQTILHGDGNLHGCYAVAAASGAVCVAPSSRQIGLQATISLFDSLRMGGRDEVKLAAQSRSQAPAFRRRRGGG